MIEQLTDKNLSLSEQMDDLRKSVEHFQDLKELNDELEVNHVEHEKQLQEVIDFKESLLSDMNRQATKQEEELTDKEYTILRFRDLVSALQSDLEDMRSSKEISELEAQNLENSSRAIMDLNRQLQASANSATVKAIDMELGKLEAQQASEHLSIVQLFLPDAFHSERDSVLALLRFKRIGFKANMLHGFIKQRIGGPSSPSHVGVDLYAACNALDKLTWVWAMCDRFVASMQTSPLEQFSRYENTLHELEPVERSLNGYIDNLRKDDLQEQHVVDGLQRYGFLSNCVVLYADFVFVRSIAVMKHIAELHLREGLESYAEEILMRTLQLQSSLENTATAILLSKEQVLNSARPTDDDEDEGILFEQRADSVISDSRSAKVIAGKVHRALQDMKSRNLSLTPTTLSQFDKCSATADELFAFSMDLGTAIEKIVHEEDIESPSSFGEILIVMRSVTSARFEGSKSDVLSPVLSKLRTLLANLTDLNGMASDITQMTEFEKPSAPWVLRSKELQDRKAISVIAEEEIRTLKRDIQERVTSLRMREQKLEEANMKIDLLEVRMRDANKKVDQISHLEHAVNQAKERERSMEKAVESQSRLVTAIEAERDRWMRKAAEAKITSKPGEEASGQTLLVGSATEMDALKSEIKTLQSTTRFLRQQTRRARTEEEAKQNSWLSTPLTALKKHNPHQDSMRAVLGKLALLPSNSKPLRLPDRVESKPKSQRMKTTPRYQLIEQEMKSLQAWDPLGLDLKGVPSIVGVDGVLGRSAVF
jgi:dynactin 1